MNTTSFITAAFVACLSLGANAQSTPNTNSNTGTTQQPTTQQPTNQGWAMWDATMSKNMGVDDNQLTRLQEVDKRYHDRYTALGDKPWTNKGYNDLTDLRERDIRAILTTEQWDMWNKKYGRQHTGMRSNTGNSGTNNGGTEPTRKY